jgi:hypothetical protein
MVAGRGILRNHGEITIRQRHLHPRGRYRDHRAQSRQGSPRKGGEPDGQFAQILAVLGGHPKNPVLRGLA